MKQEADSLKKILKLINLQIDSLKKRYWTQKNHKLKRTDNNQHHRNIDNYFLKILFIYS